MGLTDRIRGRIDRGQLPTTRPPKVVTSFGEEERCAACDQPIDSRQVSWSIERDHTLVASFHVACSRLWDADLRRRGR